MDENTNCSPTPASRVHRGRSPGAAWIPVATGLHRTGAADCLLEDLLAWSTILRPTAAFTHLTSALVRGWWLPPLPEPLPVWLALICPQNPPQRSGLIVSRHRAIPPSEVIDGVRVTAVGETLLACARDLGLIDLVVLLDCVLHLRLVDRDELQRVANQHRRGAPALRRALMLADGRSESPWETILRLFHVVCGLEVWPQYEVFDDDGRFVARGDLWLVGTTMLHEYDGGDHLLKPQQRKDLKRARRIGGADWERRGYTSEDLLHQPVGILRDADSSVGRPHDPSRVRAWNQLLRESLFTPAGTAWFCQRVGIDQPAE